jgi:DNA-binding XRE family transcriptional regulator
MPKLVTLPREESMKRLRAAGVPDATIGTAFGLTHQRVGKILGPHEREPVYINEESIDVPAYLKAWRKRNGVTQAELGRLIGIHPQTLAPWEQGRTGCSLPSLLVRYLDLLEMMGVR